MRIFVIHIFLYAILPLIAIVALILFDKSRPRRNELFLIYLIGLGSGINQIMIGMAFCTLVGGVTISRIGMRAIREGEDTI